MQQELRDISKERSVETSSNRSKQLQFDRQIAEMSLQISRLQASLREAQKGPEEYVAHGDPGSSSNQIKELTREVVRLQEKLGQSGSEVSALRNRLVVAAERAEKAEQALVEEGDIENSPSSGNSIPFGRGGGGVVSSMRRRNKRGYGSIRSSLHLDNVQDVNAKRLVKAIDIADRISVDTGKFLRYNPLARGGFILYLGMLHLWTFTVLFFHAHRFETVHGDFGAKYPHGSHAMMHHIRPPEHHEIMKSAAAMNVDSVVEGTAGGGVQGVQAVDEKDPPVDGSEKESPKQAEKNDAKKEVEASENNEEEEVENVESDPEGEAPEMEENADHNVENSEEQA